jgi:hypothetical protein
VRREFVSLVSLEKWGKCVVSPPSVSLTSFRDVIKGNTIMYTHAFEADGVR